MPVHPGRFLVTGAALIAAVFGLCLNLSAVLAGDDWSEFYRAVVAAPYEVAGLLLTGLAHALSYRGRSTAGLLAAGVVWAILAVALVVALIPVPGGYEFGVPGFRLIAFATAASLGIGAAIGFRRLAHARFDAGLPLFG